MSELKSLQHSNDETQTVFVFCKQMVLNFFQIDRKFRVSSFDEENKDTKLAIPFIQLTSSPRNPRAKSFNVH